MRAEHLKPLTSLRFVAAIWVVLFDYWPALGAPMPNLVARGTLGVELFFVLSGFILCHVYLAEAGAGRLNFGRFLWARLARIYPAHLATLLAIGVMGGAALMMGMRIDPNVLSLQALPANLLLVHAWGFSPVAGWNHPSWSISAEWFAYLAFPAFAWAAWRLRDRPALALGGAIALIFGLYGLFPRLAGFPLTQATIAWGALRIVPCFAYGCALYLAWKAGAADRRGAALIGAGVLTAAIVAFTAAGVPDAVIVSLFGLLILSLAGLSKAPVPVLSSPVFVWLGEISYAIYMVAIPWSLLFLHTVPHLLHLGPGPLPLPLWAIYVAMVVPLAAGCHHLIEKPARKAMHSLALRHFGERFRGQFA
jgi:peptidoglycan/LPS O-acetylase OafA/YrhL